MGRLFFGCVLSAILATFLCVLGACGGHKPPGANPFPVKISLTPPTSASVQLGSTITFTASAQNGANSGIAPAFTFQSSDTSILNFAPSGLACAGRWDTNFTTCTPLGSGVVEVTASALGATSAPTFVFVHPPIDNITVTEVPPITPPSTLLPCISVNQTMTLQATAWSHNSDITATVGPFTWSAASTNVVKLLPIVNVGYGVATNQATATATTPGLTQIFASASGVSSSAFQQIAPTGVVWDFFETCPVQNITLQLGASGSQQTGQTTFAVAKGTPVTVTATVTDVLGNLLTKVPLTWSASSPTAVSAATSCTQSCSISTPGPGAGTVTASCSPPTCNIGFPQNPVGLSTFPEFRPLPVYSTTAISGLATGASAATTVLASSLDCAAVNTCLTYFYDISTSKNLPGNGTPAPTPPNSLLFDQAGDKGYMGSDFGIQGVSPGNLGTTNSAFTSLGAVTGKVLAVSANGGVAIVSDTVHNPNHVYVLASSSTSNAVTTLNISGAKTAAFTPDGLKAFILGNGGSALYIYSSLQALQGPITLAAPANQIAFSPNGAFAFVTGTPSGFNPDLTAFSLCNNLPSSDTVTAQPFLPLNAAPSFLKAIPAFHLDGIDSKGNHFPDGIHLLALGTTGIDVMTIQSSASVAKLTNPPSATGSCPQSLKVVSDDPLAPSSAQHIDLGQGTFNPINFFVSPDASLAYIVATNFSSILVYNFNTGSVGGIPLVNNATPVTADISTDGTLISVAGSDGMLHEINTSTLVDETQIAFPNLPSLPNPFCTLADPVIGPCKLDFVAVKP
jgi:hypothetical protein